MNESKGMNNPHLKIVKCGGTKAQDEKKLVESLQKQQWA